MRNVIFIVVIFLLRLLAVSYAGPLYNVPQGWIDLPEEGYESTPGTYYDLLSGATVKYDVGLGFAIGYFTNDLSPSSRIDFGPLSFGRTSERCWVATLLMSDLIAGNFSACVHDKTQRDRIAQFIADSRLTLPGKKETPEATQQGCFISSQQISKIASGVKYSEVQALVGPPCFGALTSEGFKLQYWPYPRDKGCRRGCVYFSVYFDLKATVLETRTEHW